MNHIAKKIKRAYHAILSGAKRQQWINHSWTWYRQKKGHYLFPLFTFFAGWVLGMLTNPFVGTLFTSFALFITLIIVVPWEKIPTISKVQKVLPYIISVLVVIVFMIPMWYRVYGIFPNQNPYSDTISTATTTIDVSVNSTEIINFHYLDRGGLVVFLVDESHSILETSATDSYAYQTGNSSVVYHGVFEMNATQEFSKNRIYHLKQTKYIFVYFGAIPNNSQVNDGKFVLVINNSLRIEAAIPKQIVTNNIIKIENITELFSDFKKY